MTDHPDKILLSEAFTSDEAHRRHQDADHMRSPGAVAPKLLSHVVIDNVISERMQRTDKKFE